MWLNRLAALLAMIVATAGVASGAVAATPEEESAILAWRAQRVAALTSDSGWLTLVGLYWLKDGVTTFGRSTANALAIPLPSLAEFAGRFVRHGGQVRFEALRGSGITTADGAPVDRIDIAPATGRPPIVLAAGTVQFFIIERGGQFGVRVRDTASRARRDFSGLDYFPIDDSWVVDARFERYEPPRHVSIVNVLGMELDMQSPGALVFQRDGREWRLDTLLEQPDDDQLFVMFADGTSGHETYGAGRFLYVPRPPGDTVRVDFNRAHSPPCAFTTYATCPLPPPQNRIDLPVRAGELRYAAGH